jgi:hypothetical protein
MMKLSEQMATRAKRIRGSYLGTTHTAELLLEYVPGVAQIEEENKRLKRHDFYQGVFIEQVLNGDPTWERTKAYKELQDALEMSQDMS